MNLAAFQGLRRGLQINAAPATSQVRSVFEDALRQELLASGVFTELEVGSTDAADHLLVALGSFSADADEEQVSAAVRSAWAAVAFHHWQAHAILTEDGHVELQAATLDRPAGRYLTLHLVVQRTEVPVPLAPSATVPSTTVPQQRLTPPVTALAGV